MVSREGGGICGYRRVMKDIWLEKREEKSIVRRESRDLWL